MTLFGWSWQTVQQFTFAVQSLASDSSLLAGRAGTAIDLTANVGSTGLAALDWLVGGFFKTGTSPSTGKQIELWFAGSLNDTPTYPDSISGTDGNKSITSSDIKARLALWDVIPTDNTTGRVYPVRVGALSEVFGRALPRCVVPFLVHNTGQNLDSTGGNHGLWLTPKQLKGV